MREIHIGVIDGDDAVRGGREVRDLRIHTVARGHVLRAHALGRLTGAARLTHFLTGGEQHTYLSIRSDNGRDVASFRDDAETAGERLLVRLARDVRALGGDEHIAPRDDVRHLGHVR